MSAYRGRRVNGTPASSARLGVDPRSSGFVSVCPAPRSYEIAREQNACDYQYYKKEKGDSCHPRSLAMAMQQLAEICQSDATSRLIHDRGSVQGWQRRSTLLTLGGRLIQRGISRYLVLSRAIYFLRGLTE